MCCFMIKLKKFATSENRIHSSLMSNKKCVVTPKRELEWTVDLFDEFIGAWIFCELIEVKPQSVLYIFNLI